MKNPAVAVLGMLSFLLAPLVPAMELEPSLSFEFSDPESVASWRDPHSISDVRFDDGCMSLLLAGNDPYIHAPDISLEANLARYVEIALDAPAHTYLTAYFHTQEDPNYGGNKRLRLGITPANGRSVIRFDTTLHPLWKGTVTGFRLDLDNGEHPRAHVRVDYIRFLARMPELHATAAADARILSAGEPFTYRIALQNAGSYALENPTATLSLPEGLTLREGSLYARLPNIPVGGRAEVTWQLVAADPGLHSVEFAVEANHERAFVYQFDLPVFAFTRDPHVLANRNALIELPPADFGYGVMKVRTPRSDATLAVTDSFGEIIYEDLRGKIVTQKLFLHNTVSRRDYGITLADRIDLPDGGAWSVRASLDFQPRADSFDFSLSISSDTQRKILAIVAPSLYAGEGTTGDAKLAAQYPGIEYLGKDEPSSDPRDFDPVFADRSIPKMRDVTIPLMSVQTANGTVGLLWDNRFEWLPGRKGFRGWFMSPNTTHDQQNHLMALVIPSSRQETEPNTVAATRPLIVKPGERIDISCRIFASADGDALSAVDSWISGYGLPPLRNSDGYARGFDLCRYALQHTVWVPEKPGWRHALHGKEWPVSTYAHNTLGLLLDASREKDPKIAKSLLNQGMLVADVILNNIDGHNAGYELPFHMGRVPRAVERQRGAAENAMRRQSPDGSWPFTPTSAKLAALGNKGDTEIGICANHALPLIQYARIAGDEDAVAASVKALDRMSQFEIPRAAQVWEITVHAPDVVGASRAVRCFTEGYLLTGDRKYLNEAARWARTGIPFIYLWDNGENEAFPYASIPVLGSTFWQNTWVGRPVQWCGLDLARWLLWLAEFDDSRDWRRLAQGIIESATRQLQRSGPYKGLLPDFWLFDPDMGDGPMIDPSGLHVDLLSLLGTKPYVYTQLAALDGDALRISSGARIESPQQQGGNTLTFTLSEPLFGESYVYVTGGPEPQHIIAAGKRLPRVEDVDAADQGWTVTDKGAVYAKILHDNPTDVTVQYP